MGTDWAVHARQVLRRAGHHRGAARERLIDLLARQDCALSALEIEDGLRSGSAGGGAVGGSAVGGSAVGGSAGGGSAGGGSVCAGSSSGERPVGRASVYRALELLHDHDLVSRLDLGDGVARYEPVDPGGEHHHHHLVCDQCGQLVPFDDLALERSINQLSRRLGFDTKEHEVTLRGNCPACR